MPTYSSRRSSASSLRLARLADRQRPVLERGQEDGVPLEALGAVIGQELHAGDRAARLGVGASLDLVEERGDVRVGIGPGEVLGQLEQRDDGRVPFARGVGFGHVRPADAELALERLGEPLRERGRRRLRDPADVGRPVQCRGHPQRPTDLRSSEEPLAANVERDARGAKPRLQGGSWALVRTRMAISPCAVPSRASARMAVVIARELRLVGVEARDVRLRPAVERRDEPLRGPRDRAGRALVRGGSSRREDPVREGQDLRRGAEVALEPHDARRRDSEPGTRSGSRSSRR